VLVATALHKANVSKEMLWKLVLSCRETGIQLIGTQSHSAATTGSKDASVCQLTSQNTISFFQPFLSKSFPLLTRLLQATKRTKFVSDAQESRKQNKNTVKGKGRRIYNTKSEPVFYHQQKNCIFLSRVKFYLHSNWLYFVLYLHFNLVSRKGT